MYVCTLTYTHHSHLNGKRNWRGLQACIPSALLAEDCSVAQFRNSCLLSSLWSSEDSCAGCREDTWEVYKDTRVRSKAANDLGEIWKGVDLWMGSVLNCGKKNLVKLGRSRYLKNKWGGKAILMYQPVHESLCFSWIVNVKRQQILQKWHYVPTCPIPQNKHEPEFSDGTHNTTLRPDTASGLGASANDADINH